MTTTSSDGSSSLACKRRPQTGVATADHRRASARRSPDQRRQRVRAVGTVEPEHLGRASARAAETSIVTREGNGGLRSPTMRAVVCHELGEPEALVVDHVDTVPCGPGQVRVRVWACGVNYVDALFVQGRYQIKPSLPFTPGPRWPARSPRSGTASTGGRSAIGSCRRSDSGGFADEMVVGAAQLLRASPTGCHFGQARDDGPVLRHRAVHTHPAHDDRPRRLGRSCWAPPAASVWPPSTWLASLGASTLAVVSSPERARLCIERGAHAVIDYSHRGPQDAGPRAHRRGGRHRRSTRSAATAADAALRALGDMGGSWSWGSPRARSRSSRPTRSCCATVEVIGVDWGAWAMANPEANAALLREILAMAAEGAPEPGRADDLPARRCRPGPARPPGAPHHRQGRASRA